MADAQSIFKANYKDFLSSLKKTSFDSENNIYLCQDVSAKVYNFDAIVKQLYPFKQPSSFDALIIDENRIFCIEFKNEKYAGINNSEVKKKLKNGKDIIIDMFKKYNININHYTFTYCVAYRNTDAKWRRNIAKNTIQFGLEQFKPKYFDEIFTNDVAFFTNEYKKYFKDALVC